MHANACPALVLNADHTPLFPIKFSRWQDSILGVCRGAFSVVAEYDRVVRSPSTEIRIPAVIASRIFVKPQRPAFTRYNVFLRDHFRCQYCAKRFAGAELTFDHVVPRTRGGRTEWTNIVAACRPCNMGKDDRIELPLCEPLEPSTYQLVAASREFPPNHLHESWIDFLYWDAVLEK